MYPLESAWCRGPAHQDRKGEKGSRSLVYTAQLSPLGTEQLQLRHDVRIPQSANNQKEKAEISKGDSEEPTNFRQTAHHLGCASCGMDVLSRAPSVLHCRRPNFDILHHVPCKISHNEARGQYDKICWPIFMKV